MKPKSETNQNMQEMISCGGEKKLEISVRWVDLETGEIHSKTFQNYDDYLEYRGTKLFLLDLQNKIKIL